MDITDTKPLDLTGKLLIAMPGMGDPRFEHSVIFMCAHSEEGAMGLIVNKPADEVVLRDVLDQLDISPENAAGSMPVHFGGPVEVARGFVLHTPDYTSRLQTLDVAGTFAMSATVDILEDIAKGEGPRKSMIMLGYSGWGPGQLEDEIGQNGWLTSDADPDLVFEDSNTTKWLKALERLGVDPLGLSATAGHA
ncbi:MAG: YqgE/AlgH family protein [Paracoccaceae bacterium]